MLLNLNHDLFYFIRYLQVYCIQSQSSIVTYTIDPKLYIICSLSFRFPIDLTILAYLNDIFATSELNIRWPRSLFGYFHEMLQEKPKRCWSTNISPKPAFSFTQILYQLMACPLTKVQDSSVTGDVSFILITRYMQEFLLHISWLYCFLTLTMATTLGLASITSEPPYLQP